MGAGGGALYAIGSKDSGHLTDPKEIRLCRSTSPLPHSGAESCGCHSESCNRTMMAVVQQRIDGVQHHAKQGFYLNLTINNILIQDIGISQDIIIGKHLYPTSHRGIKPF